MRRPCCEKQETNKGAWTKQEDQILIDYIRKHGEGCWRSLPQAAGLLRCGKSCRLRWINYLRPDLKRGNFAEDEEDLIIKLHALLGNRWSLIAGRLPGRTDNEIKNYWNSHLRKKLISMGIDPTNHKITPCWHWQRPQHSHSPTSSLSRSTSAESKPHKQNEDRFINEEKKQQGARQQPSGSATNYESDSTVLPDLNLELCITTPPPPPPASVPPPPKAPSSTPPSSPLTSDVPSSSTTVCHLRRKPEPAPPTLLLFN
ncbi:unnamed protein product [Victoria cruziana]